MSVRMLVTWSDRHNVCARMRAWFCLCVCARARVCVRARAHMCASVYEYDLSVKQSGIEVSIRMRTVEGQAIVAPREAQSVKGRVSTACHHTNTTCGLTYLLTL